MVSRLPLYTSGAGLLLAVCGVLSIAACRGEGQTAASTTPVAPGMLALDEDPPPPGEHARLWAENCIRCHNMRTPASLSDRQWELVMHHMRVRANLTAREHEQIVQFLQAAN